MSLMALFRGPAADPISEEDLADLMAFRLPPAEPEPEGIQAQTLVKAETELTLLSDRERREQEALDTITEALRQTRIAKRSVEAMIAVLVDGRPVRPADLGANVVMTHNKIQAAAGSNPCVT